MGLRRLLLAVLLVAAARPAAGQMASLQDLDREFVQVVKDVAPAVVQVEPGISGVCVSADGYVLTDGIIGQILAQNGAKTARVTFPDQRSFPARLHAADVATNTVVLKVDTRSSLPAVRAGDPGSLQVGHFLLTIGNAFGTATEGEPAVTLGVVAAIHRDAEGTPLLMETSAATNPGQNGGPYFNTEGELVGLARGLPNGQDLATVTPIDRIRTAYAAAPNAERILSQPMSLRPPRTKGGILSAAFHIAAMRARSGAVTLLVTSSGEPPVAEAAAEPVEDGGDKAPEERAAPQAQSIPPRDGPLTGTLVRASGLVVASALEFRGTIAGIEALLADGRRFPATLVARDHKSGLALLRLEKRPEDEIVLLENFPQTALQVGQFTLAVGAPHGPPATREPFVTVGLLSGRHRLNGYLDALQTDAGINVKNAGGLLVDLRGRALGVLLPPALPFGQNSGLGFALPWDVLEARLPRLLEGEDIEPAYIGVTLSDLPDRAGVQVDEVRADFPGERGGLAAGDVITHLDGEPIRDRRHLSDFLWVRKSAGDPLAMRVDRNGRAVDLELALVARPDS